MAKRRTVGKKTKNIAKAIRAKMDQDPELKRLVNDARRRMSLGEQIVASLQEFADKIERGERIEVTTVRVSDGKVIRKRRVLFDEIAKRGG